MNPEDILDQCIEARRAGRDPEEILREHPECADEVRSLLALLPALEALPEPQPSLPGLMRTLARTAAEASGGRTSVRTRSVVFRLLTVSSRVAAAAAVLFAAGWAASAASSSALPGDFLYPLKLLTERVRFYMAPDPVDKAELRIVFSEKRLIEAIRRQRQGEGIDPELLKAMLDEAQKALEETRKLPESTRDLLHARIANVWEFQGKTLEQIRDQAPPEERAVVEPFVEMCRRRCGWMRRMRVGRRWGDRGEGAASSGTSPTAGGTGPGCNHAGRRGMRQCPMEDCN